MGASQRPIFDSTVDQAPSQPIFPTNVQATGGMATAPAPTAGFAAGLGGAADAMQQYQDVAIGKLARIHAMVDAGQLPQTALSDPSLQPLFHQAGLDQEGHLALLPKPQDQVTQLKSDELNLPQNAAGTPNAATITGMPSEAAGNVQQAADVGTRDPNVALVQSKTPTAIQAGNTVQSEDTKSRSDVMNSAAGFTEAKQAVQLAEDNVSRYDATGKNADPVFRNALQVAYAKVMPYYIETMKQQIAASQLSSAQKLAANNLLVSGFEERATVALTAAHESWMKSQQAQSESIQSNQLGEDSTPEVKQQELNQQMTTWNAAHPEPTLSKIMDQQMEQQQKLFGLTQGALTPMRSNIAGTSKDAGSARANEVDLLDNIERQLLHSHIFTIDAPPGTTTIDPNTKKRVPVAAGSRISGTAEMLLNSTDPWATPAIKDHVRRFLKQGDPTLVNDPTAKGAGGGGHTPMSPAGVGRGAQPTATGKVTLPPVQ